MTNGEEFIRYRESYMRGSGLWFESSLLKRFLVLCLLLPMSLIVDVCVLFDFQHISFSGGINTTVNIFESVSTFGQLIIRKFILIFHRKKIQDVLNERKKFWDFNTFGEKSGKTLKLKMILATKVIRTIVTLGTLVVFLICVAAVVQKKTTPLESWSFENKYLNRALFFMQAVSFVEILYLIGAVDGFYVLVCVDIKIQFILLEQKLKTIRFDPKNEKQIVDDLICITNHHKLLLGIHKKFNKVFSEYIVIQYIINVLAVSAEFYVFLYLKSSIEDMLKSALYLVCLFLQVAMFFLPASDVEEQADNYAMAIYNLNWEQWSSRKIRKQILFMMMRAQEPLTILAGGMVHVNRREYIKLFKLGFSISTIFDGMNNLK